MSQYNTLDSIGRGPVAPDPDLAQRARAAIDARKTDLQERLQAARVRAQERIAERREREDQTRQEQAQRQHARQILAAEDAEAVARRHARQGWIASGGHPDQFADAWPGMWQAQLEKAALSAAARPVVGL